MNPMPNALLQTPSVPPPSSAFEFGFLDVHDKTPDPLQAPASTNQRQGRHASVNGYVAQAAVNAVVGVGMSDAAGSAVPIEELQLGYAGPARRFDAWLHGCEVLDAPEPARYLDDPERMAEALAHQYRAVRSSSYVPAPTPRLLL